MSALEDIAAERRRQIEVEGRTRESDDLYRMGVMASAAASYAIFASVSDEEREPFKTGHVPYQWPWAPSSWKLTTRRRDLIKAGALIVAEIERLDRAEAKANDMALRDADFSPV